MCCSYFVCFAKLHILFRYSPFSLPFFIFRYYLTKVYLSASDQTGTSRYRFLLTRLPIIRRSVFAVVRPAFSNGTDKNVLHDLQNESDRTVPRDSSFSIQYLCASCTVSVLHKKGQRHQQRCALSMSLPLGAPVFRSITIVCNRSDSI